MAKAGVKKQRITTVWWVLVMMLAAAVMLRMLYDRAQMSQELDVMHLHSLISDVEHAYKIEKLEFCLKHGVTDCSDAALTAWNSAHPDRVFTLKSSRDLAEAASRELEIYKKK